MTTARAVGLVVGWSTRYVRKGEGRKRCGTIQEERGRCPCKWSNVEFKCRMWAWKMAGLSSVRRRNWIEEGHRSCARYQEWSLVAAIRIPVVSIDQFTKPRKQWKNPVLKYLKAVTSFLMCLHMSPLSVTTPRQGTKGQVEDCG